METIIMKAALIFSLALTGILAVAYVALAFALLFSEDLNGAPTIYNFIGLAMFIIPILIGKLITKK